MVNGLLSDELAAPANTFVGVNLPPYEGVPSYVFRVGLDCNNNLTVDDNPGDPGYPDVFCTNSGCAADINGSGAVTVQDLFDFLALCSQAIFAQTSTRTGA